MPLDRRSECQGSSSLRQCRNLGARQLEGYHRPISGTRRAAARLPKTNLIMRVMMSQKRPIPRPVPTAGSPNRPTPATATRSPLSYRLGDRVSPCLPSCRAPGQPGISSLKTGRSPPGISAVACDRRRCRDRWSPPPNYRPDLRTKHWGRSGYCQPGCRNRRLPTRLVASSNSGKCFPTHSLDAATPLSSFNHGRRFYVHQARCLPSKPRSQLQNLPAAHPHAVRLSPEVVVDVCQGAACVSSGRGLPPAAQIDCFACRGTRLFDSPTAAGW